jgi:hypothetical protein
MARAVESTIIDTNKQQQTSNTTRQQQDAICTTLPQDIKYATLVSAREQRMLLLPICMDATEAAAKK